MDKIISVSISMNNIQHKVVWKFSSDGKFSVKTVSWADTDKISPHPKTNFLNYIWKLNFVPTSKLFAWKLIKVKYPTRGYLINIKIDINGACSFCRNYMKD